MMQCLNNSFPSFKHCFVLRVRFELTHPYRITGSEPAASAIFATEAF